MIPSPGVGDPAGGPDDTIVALSSGRPPAAVAIVRTSGPRATAMLEALTGRHPPPLRRAGLRQLADPENGEPIDDALVLRFAAPESATGEDVVEYQCHGGRAVVERLLAVLVALDGARLAEPGEFTRRALANGRIDLTEAEGLADLIAAETEAQRKAALQVAEGGVRRLSAEWRERLIALSAKAEAAIDYVGDEDETAIDEAALAASAGELGADIASWLARPRAERLKDGIRVVAAGPPNAGKSSLINALAGTDRAIVTDVPGTTRDVIEIPVAVDGLPFVLVDTAGLRSSDDRVERIGIARAEAELARADVLLWLGNLGDVPRHNALLRVFPRIDQPGRSDPPGDTLGVSSVTGDGLGELWRAIRGRAEDLLPGEGEVALNRRQAECLAAAADSLRLAASGDDIAIVAHNLTTAREALDRLTGVSGVEDVLDALFSRFCLGK